MDVTKGQILMNVESPPGIYPPGEAPGEKEARRRDPIYQAGQEDIADTFSDIGEGLDLSGDIATIEAGAQTAATAAGTAAQTRESAIAAARARRRRSSIFSGTTRPTLLGQNYAA